MNRKLDIKKGQIVYSKIELGSNAARRKEPFSIDTFDAWVTECVVVSVGRKYITVGSVTDPLNKWSQTKFDIENDYREHYTSGGSDSKLYTSKQEILDEMEYENIFDSVKPIFNMYGNLYGRCKLSLDKLRRIKNIIDENE